MNPPTAGHPNSASDPFDLRRFTSAQDDGATYAAALKELRDGRKRSHWMWFVFPQIAGLGRSHTAQHYAISGLAEASAYLAHPVLGRRLTESARAVTDLPTTDPVQVFGSVDAQKLRSSMTLFAHAAQTTQNRATFTSVLDKYFDGQEDQATRHRL